MMAKAPDRRIQRTRALLLHALLALIEENGYEAVSIQHIVDRANVGRSTFYAHFLDKRQLLLSGLADLADFLGQAQPSAGSESELLGFSLALFEHAEENFAFCRSLLGPHSAAVVEPDIVRILGDLIRAELAARVARGAVMRLPAEVVVQFCTSALWGLLVWWVAQPAPVPAVELDRQFRALALPGVAAACGAGG